MTPVRYKLPIDIQTFSQIFDGGYYLLWIKRRSPGVCTNTASATLLPRRLRFDKSLLLDTLEELFEHAGPLFRRLYIHARWE
jgi:hypothetical protein